MAGQCLEGRCVARLGRDRHGEAMQGEVYYRIRRGKARHGRARLGMAGPGLERQGKVINERRNPKNFNRAGLG